MLPLEPSERIASALHSFPRRGATKRAERFASIKLCAVRAIATTILFNSETQFAFYAFFISSFTGLHNLKRLVNLDRSLLIRAELVRDFRSLRRRRPAAAPKQL